MNGERQRVISRILGNYYRPNVFDSRLQSLTERIWKILKLDWKTPGFFPPIEWELCPQSSTNPVLNRGQFSSVVN